MLTYQTETYMNALEDAMPLLLSHWAEIAENKSVFDLINPDVELYQKLEEQNALKVLTIRDDGKLVGYFVIIIKPHLHYKHVLCAHDDLFFLHKDYRKGFNGIRLIKIAEHVARECGAQIMIIKTKFNKRDLTKLLDRLDYEATEIVMTKKL